MIGRAFSAPGSNRCRTTQGVALSYDRSRLQRYPQLCVQMVRNKNVQAPAQTLVCDAPAQRRLHDYATMSINSFSPISLTPSFRAFASFEPGSAPTTR